jgi:hypothetical protein
MYGNRDRIDQFKTEIADMKLRDRATTTDRLLTRLGLVGLVVGPGLGVIAWFLSHNTSNPLQQRDAIVLALLGVAIAVVGAVLWLKAALAAFLRFWLARLSYEQQAQSDRVAAAVTGGSPPSAPSTPPPASTVPAAGDTETNNQTRSPTM